MDWLSVLLLVGLGLIFLIIEMLFIPGTTFVGIIGFVLAIVGIVLAYTHFGPTVGTIVLAGSTGLGVGIAVYSVRSGVWDRFANKETVKGRFNDAPFTITLGDIGETVSALRPIGKAEFGNTSYEVRTFGNYVEPGQRVKVTQIDHRKIFVEPVND